MLRIAHLYPDLMNLYGDQGNLTVLKKRAEWYGQPLEIVPISLGDDLPIDSIDMIFMGGGSDREQGLITEDLLRHKDKLLTAIESGLPFLAICGAFQLLGREYITFEGDVYPGLNFFPFYTKGDKVRMIGNVALECTVGGEKCTVVGFENHGGKTWLEGQELQPFGKVLSGFGNNGTDGTEGFMYKNLIATYLHGPLLPKNPKIADFFLKAMFERKNLPFTGVLDDTLENFANRQIYDRFAINSK